MDNSAEIRAGIRGILTGLWLDSNQLKMSYRAGEVRLTGSLQKIPGRRRGEVTPQLIDALEHKIRQLRGVRRLHMDFTNWTREGAGGWIPSGP